MCSGILHMYRLYNVVCYLCMLFGKAFSRNQARTPASQCPPGFKKEF